MAQTKKTVPPTDDTSKVNGTGNGQVDAAKDANKTLVATLKAAGIDTKGMYTEYTADPADVKDTLEFMVKKNAKNPKVGITQATMDAALVMFTAMQAANAPKVKVTKEIPQDLAQAWKTAYDMRQQFYAEKAAAYAAFDKVWNDKQAESKAAINTARAFVETNGFYVKGDAVIATKSGSTTTDGTHGNSGKSKLSIGWTIQIGTVNYTGWKDVAEKLVPSVFKGETNTNYLANTAVLDKVVEMGLPVEIWAKVAVKDANHETAIVAWENSAAKAKLDAHPTITVHVS